MQTTGRRKYIFGLAVCTLILAAAFLAVPVAGPPLIPMQTEGRAFDRAGSPLPIGTPIRTFIDGVDYSNDAIVQNGQGSFVVQTKGNSVGPGNTSDTLSIQEGANIGDAVIYAASNFTTAAEVFQEVIGFSPRTFITTDLHLGSVASTPEPVKIEGIVARPAAGGNPYVYLCNPAASPVSLADYYLELDRPGTYHGPALALTGVLDPFVPFRVNLSSAFPLTPTGDALKAVYRNPGGAGATAGGRDIVVDRVEFNATRDGTLYWEPGNTNLTDAPAPDAGQILQRDASCTDTNRPEDFSLGQEPDIGSNGPPTISISSPAPGQTIAAGTTVTFAWTMSDDVFSTAYLHVWANVTMGNQTTALLVDALNTISVVWTAPDVAVAGAVFHVDVVDPFGARASDARTFTISRESPIALLIAVLIAIVLLAFLILGFLRARKAEQRPSTPTAPPPLPSPPAGPILGGPAVTAPAEGKKVCPRCHTTVNAIDVTCFYCGYRFPGEGAPP